MAPIRFGRLPSRSCANYYSMLYTVRTIKITLELAAILALLSLARAAWYLGNTERSIADSVRQIDRSVVIVSKSATDILTQVRQAADAVRGSSGAEAAYWQGVSGRTTR